MSSIAVGLDGTVAVNTPPSTHHHHVTLALDATGLATASYHSRSLAMGANHSRGHRGRDAAPTISTANIAARMAELQQQRDSRPASSVATAVPVKRGSFSKSTVMPINHTVIAVQEKRPSILEQLQQTRASMIDVNVADGCKEDGSRATAVFELTEIAPQPSSRRASVERVIEPADGTAPAMSTIVRAALDAHRTQQERREARRRSGDSKRDSWRGSVTEAQLSTRASRAIEMRAGFHGAPMSINTSLSTSSFASPLSSPLGGSQTASPRAFALTALPSPSTSMINLNVYTPGASPSNHRSGTKGFWLDDTYTSHAKKHKVNSMTALQLLPSSSLTASFASHLDAYSLSTLFEPSQSLLNSLWSHYTNGMQTSTLPFVSLNSLAGDITNRILRHHAELYVNKQLRKKKKMLAKVRRAHGQNDSNGSEECDDSDLQWLDGDDIGLSGVDVKRTLNRQRLYLLPGSKHDSAHQSVQCMLRFLCQSLDVDADRNIRKSEFSAGFGTMLKGAFLSKEDEWQHKRELKQAKKLGRASPQRDKCSVM